MDTIKVIPGRVIGIELLHYRPSSGGPRLAVETVIHTNT